MKVVILLLIIIIIILIPGCPALIGLFAGTPLVYLNESATEDAELFWLSMFGGILLAFLIYYINKKYEQKKYMPERLKPSYSLNSRTYENSVKQLIEERKICFDEALFQKDVILQLINQENALRIQYLLGMHLYVFRNKYSYLAPIKAEKINWYRFILGCRSYFKIDNNEHLTKTQIKIGIHLIENVNSTYYCFFDDLWKKRDKELKEAYQFYKKLESKGDTSDFKSEYNDLSYSNHNKSSAFLIDKVSILSGESRTKFVAKVLSGEKSGPYSDKNLLEHVNIDALFSRYYEGVKDVHMNINRIDSTQLRSSIQKIKNFYWYIDLNDQEKNILLEKNLDAYFYSESSCTEGDIDTSDSDNKIEKLLCNSLCLNSTDFIEIKNLDFKDTLEDNISFEFVGYYDLYSMSNLPLPGSFKDSLKPSHLIYKEYFVIKLLNSSEKKFDFDDYAVFFILDYYFNDTYSFNGKGTYENIVQPKKSELIIIPNSYNVKMKWQHLYLFLKKRDGNVTKLYKIDRDILNVSSDELRSRRRKLDL